MPVAQQGFRGLGQNLHMCVFAGCFSAFRALLIRTPIAKLCGFQMGILVPGFACRHCFLFSGLAHQAVLAAAAELDLRLRLRCREELELVVTSTKSFCAKKEDVQRSWHIADADGKIVGRLASEIAVLLMGKHKPTYTPHVDTGDFVIVVNAEKIQFSGRKWEQKEYTWYTGYPGLRKITAADRLKRQPELILKEAVRRMLPKNKLGRKMLAKLKIFVGPNHPHQAQTPQPVKSQAGS